MSASIRPLHDRVLIKRIDEQEQARGAGVLIRLKSRAALQNAASINCLPLTTEAVVAEMPEEKKKGRCRLANGLLRGGTSNG